MKNIVINDKFLNNTYIYIIDIDTFNNFCLVPHNIEGNIPNENYIISAVKNNNDYYLILCLDPSPRDNIGLFEETYNIVIKFIAIGNEVKTFYNLMFNCGELKDVYFSNSIDT